MNNGEALTLYQSGGIELAMSRTPEFVLSEAAQGAKALKDVVEKTKAAIKLGESEHLKNEAWQTLGHFYDLASRIVETRFVQYGNAEGFLSVAELVHIPTGKVISRAEAMCLNDEDKWSTRTKYAWAYIKKSGGTSIEDPGKDEIIWENNKPKKKKIKVGDESVPRFQLMSMSQTRASSKVHANALKWVVVLAGYNPTPAEEVDGNEDGLTDTEQTRQPIQQPQRRSAQPAAQEPPVIPDEDGLFSEPPNQQPAAQEYQPPPKSSGPIISEAQSKRLYAIARGNGFTDAHLKDELARFGYESSKDVTKDHYEEVVAFFQNNKP